MMSDFPEFDAAYNTILIRDKEDRFEHLAAQANFNVYHSDIWRGTGRKFAEAIVEECITILHEHIDESSSDARFLALKAYRQDLKEHFGINNAEQRNENIRNRSTYSGHDI